MSEIQKQIEVTKAARKIINIIDKKVADEIRPQVVALVHAELTDRLVLKPDATPTVSAGDGLLG